MSIAIHKRKALDTFDDDTFFALHAEALAIVVSAAETAYKARRVASSKLRVISGGQTGADRAALEAARSVHVPTGGTAPCGFLTANGRDHTLRTVFGLRELPNAKSISKMFVLRSQRNVDDADATIAFRLKASVGTDKTIGYAITRKWRVASARDFQRPERQHYKPCLVVRSVDDVEAAAEAIVDFAQRTGARTINVCGHRNDETAGVPGFADVVRRVVQRALVQIVNG